MTTAERLAQLAGLDASTSDAFKRARYQTLLRQVPFLYLGLIGVTLAITHSFFGTAPAVLTIVVPAVLILIGLERLHFWLKVAPGYLHPRMLDAELHRVPRIASLMSLVYALWTIALGRYGDAPQVALLSFLQFVWMVNSVYSMSAVPMTAFFVIPLMTSIISIQLLWLGETIYTTAVGVFIMTSFMIFTVIRESYNNLAGMVSFQEATEQKRLEAEQAERQTREIAFLDPLTGLANRRKFENDVAERIGTDEAFGLILIDLDGFKPVNDVYGHKAGDLVLQEVAARLSEELSGRGLLARLGGDEFGVVVRTAPGSLAVHALAKRLCEELRHPFILDNGHMARISGSCGIAFYPANGNSPDKLINNADVALYESKNRARGQATVFSPHLDLALRRRSRIEQALRGAIVAEDFFLHFQPIVDIDRYSISSLEALARWTDPELGAISPGEFIPLAEQAGLIDQLSDILLRKAAAEAALWPDHTLLSFNLSALQLVKPEIGLRILGTLAKTGLSPSRLEIEVTESAVMSDFDAALATINGLRAAGIRTSLDDFGVGYASFSYLHKIAFDRVKIDRSFTAAMRSDVKARQIVKAVIDLCHGLDMECVAEGIEARDQLETLQELGCRLGQGFHLAPPLAAEAVSARLYAGCEAERIAGMARRLRAMSA
jgi:diguanylate cyclase (GGDEF)-like protein